MIKSEIVADSLNPVGCRLTSFVLEYPRYIHSEIMTHRVFSRNAASSRAIPIEKMIAQVMENPVIPAHWGKNQSGMQANEELTPIERGEAVMLWLDARDAAVERARKLSALGLHKQIANRIMEPWFHIKIILSGTEFENFFALRAHEAAHPDFRALAYLMLDQYNASEPRRLRFGEWHVPFGDKMDMDRAAALGGVYRDNMLKIAVARCARISYLNYEGNDDYEADCKLCDRLFGASPKHLSPAEHVAQATGDYCHYGNFTGFRQFRKRFADENLRDERVTSKMPVGPQQNQ